MNLTLHSHWDRHPEHIQRQLVWLQSGQAFKPKTTVLRVFLWMVGLVAIIGLLVFQSMWLFAFLMLLMGFVLWLTGLDVRQSFRRQAYQDAVDMLQSPVVPEKGMLQVTLHPFEALDRRTSDGGTPLVHFVPFARRIHAELELCDGTRFVFALDPLMKEVKYEAGSHEVDVYRHSQSARPVLLVSSTQVICPYTPCQYLV